MLFCALSACSAVADIFSPYVGEAERVVREAFKLAREARPAIVFLDELDAVVARRSASGDGSGAQRGVLTTLLNEMDGVDSGSDVLVMGATNRLDVLDAALLRYTASRGLRGCAFWCH